MTHMTTDRRTRVVVRRYSRAARWFHAAVYLSVLVLLVTGWWLALGREGQPSPLSRLAGAADTELHTWIGWALVIVVMLGILAGARGVAMFTRESLRYDRGDLRWLGAWPKAAFTGRFAHHDGHFDPGQRLANLVLVALLAVLIGSGVGLALLSGGPSFAWLARAHRRSTYAITPILMGHIVIASGILPGYRGVARSMHLGGKLRAEVAQRIWPGWFGRHRDN
jgi:cytochrome b subunit of formate dehydrogenase